MLRTRKVTKNRTSTAVPATGAPFVPSSVPSSDLHWRKAAIRKAKGEKLSRSASAGRNNDRKIKNRTSEYEEKYIEWELPEREGSGVVDRRHAPTGFYERDINAFDWKSEQQRSYLRKEVDPRSVRTAGVPRAKRTEAPSAFAWDADELRINSDNEEPSSSSRGHTVRASSAGRVRHLASEHTSKFSWPAMAERAQSAKPPPAAKSSPLAYDTSALLNSAELWHSEYDAQCAELRRKQQELMQGKQTVAGVPSQAHGDIPPFYAWEEDEAAARTARPPQPVLSGAHRGTSEYKMKFVEHPLTERTKPIIPEVPEQLNLFHVDHPEVRDAERVESVLHHDYPGHDVTALGLARTNSPGRGRDDHNPKSFAWPLVDGGVIDDDEETPERTLMRRNRVKNLVMANNTCSEYTRNFPVHPHDAYVHRAHPQKPAVGKALDLFHGDGAVEESKGLTSEYTAKFKVPDGAVSSPRVTAASQASATGKHYPTQFAWALVDGGVQTLESPARPKRPVLPTQDMSEYSRKFQWPPAIERSPPRHGDTSAASPNGRTESVIGLTTGALGGSQWQSEYDQQCALLRQKQQELLANTQPAHIAGVPTKQREAIPTNYAWEMPPPGPVRMDLDDATERVAPMHSEYGDAFVQWPLAKRETIKPRPAAETLNLFREEASTEAKGNAGDEASTAGSITRSQIKSEYAENFHAFDGPLPRPPIATSAKGQPLPPQFAWPRVDPPAPPSEHIKSAEEPAFNETSEYDAKFAWPAVTQPTPIVRPGAAPGGVTSSVSASSVILPIPDKNSADNKWVSEYGAHAADAVHTADVANTPAAGKVTATHGKIPHFYAWREKDVPPPPAPKVELPRYHGEQVRSEHDDAFVAWPVAPRAEPVARRKVSAAPSLNLLSDPSDLSNSAAPLESEYHASFTAHSAQELKALENPYKHIVSSAIEVPKPPQFAWPLVDGLPKQEPVKRSESPTAPHSEYASQFVWHEASDAAAQNTRASRTHKSGDAAVLTAPIPFDEDALRTRDWKSEYDDRCALLRQKQLELSAKAAPEFVAGVLTVPPEDAPPFYAYEVKAEKKPSVPAPVKSEPELTEYTANFKPFPIKPETAGSNRRGSDLYHKETFKTFQFGKGERSFQGISEYDDQYSPKTPSSPAPAHSLSASMNAKYSAPNPIVPPPPPGAEARPQTAPAGGKRAKGKGKGTKLTENAASYQWPDKSKLSGSVIPVLHSQKTSVVLGANPAAVLRNKKTAFARKPQHTGPATAGPPAGPVAMSQDTFHESAFQGAAASFDSDAEAASLPVRRIDHSRKPLYTGPVSASHEGDAHGVSETKDSNADDSVTGTKYKLMSQEIRDRRAGNTSRSDFTTGVLNSTTRSNDVTVNRHAAGAQHFHISNQFGENVVPLDRTGTMSADSLGKSGFYCHREASAPIAGLRFPAQTSHEVYRARSVPNRQRLAVSYNYDSRPPAKSRVVDDTDSNPVLMHKRYPYVSTKQLGRWSTETRDSFRWRKKGGLNTSAISNTSR